MHFLKSIRRFIVIFCLLFCPEVVRADGPNLSSPLKESKLWSPEPAKDKNAATYFLQGFAAMRHVTNASPVLPWIGDGEVVAPNQPIPPAMAKDIEELLTENETVFQFFEEGSRLRECRYPIDPQPTYLTKLPHLAKIKSSVKLLGLRAFWLAHTGEAEAAGNTLLLMLALERSLESEPFTISQLVRTACINYAGTSLEEIVNRVSLPPQILKQIQTELDAIEEVDAAGAAYAHALLGEQILSRRFFEVPIEQQLMFFDFFDETTNATPAERKGYLQGMRDSKDIEFLGQSLETLRALWSQGYPARAAVRDFCAMQVAEAGQRNCVFSEEVLKTFPRTYVREVRGVARVRLTKIAVALERYRLEHRDVYPELLSDLVPKYLAVLPRDPAEGKPLQYHRVKKGYKLLCVAIPQAEDSSSSGDNRIPPKDPTFVVIQPPHQ